MLFVDHYTSLLVAKSSNELTGVWSMMAKIPESPWGSPIPIGDGDGDGDVNRFPDGDGDEDRDEAEKRGWGWNGNGRCNNMDNDGWVHVRRKRQGMADNKCKENDNNKSRREGSSKDWRDFDKVM
ncbi:hypothetical protein Tco_0010589 [Tanacetum coccineum]